MPDGRRYDADASRAAILEAAERLFMEKGFAGTSVSALAKAAGVTKSLIHHHFGSKEALWEAVKASMFSEFHDQQMTMLRSAEADDALLENSFLLYFRFLRAHPDFMRLKAWMSLEESDDGDCEALDKELMTLGVQRIAEGQQLGLIRNDIPAAFVLTCFLGLVEMWFANPTLARAALVGGGELAPDAPLEGCDEQYMQYAIRLFFEGVRPR